MKQLSKQDILDSIETHKKCIAECEEMLAKLPKSVLPEIGEGVQGFAAFASGFVNCDQMIEYQNAFQTFVDLLRCEGSVKQPNQTTFSHQFLEENNNIGIYRLSLRALIGFNTLENAANALNKIGQDRVKQMINVFYGE